MDHDAPDAAREWQPHVRPCAPRVDRLIHAVANRDVTSDPRLTRAGPDGIRGAPRHGKRAHGVHFLVVEDRVPMDAAIGGLPETARRCAGVVGVRVADHSGHRRHTIAHRPDVAPAKRGRRGRRVGTALRCECRRTDPRGKRDDRGECGEGGANDHRAPEEPRTDSVHNGVLRAEVRNKR